MGCNGSNCHDKDFSLISGEVFDLPEEILGKGRNAIGGIASCRAFLVEIGDDDLLIGAMHGIALRINYRKTNFPANDEMKHDLADGMDVSVSFIIDDVKVNGRERGGTIYGTLLHIE